MRKAMDKVQKVQKIREAIDKIQDSTMDKNGNLNSDYDQGRYDALCDADTLLQNLLDEFILEQNLSNVQRTVKNWKEEPAKRTPADIEAAMQEVEEKSRVFTEAHKGEDADTILAQMRGEEPVSEELEEAAIQFATDTETGKVDVVKQSSFFWVAIYQKQQIMAKAIDVEVNVDAGGYPYIPQMELYDYDKDVALAKEGDKYKVVLIKEDKV